MQESTTNLTFDLISYLVLMQFSYSYLHWSLEIRQIFVCFGLLLFMVDFHPVCFDSVLDRQPHAQPFVPLRYHPIFGPFLTLALFTDFVLFPPLSPSDNDMS